jgi:hypothetical protein
MRRRELRVVATEKVVGAVVAADDGTVAFEEFAGDVFSGLRRRLGDAETARRLLDDGWSNGYLYLTDAQ